MDLNQFTIKSQEAITKAQQLCLSQNQQQVENSHLLLALIETDQNVIPHILQKSNADIGIVKANLQKTIQGYPQVTGGQIQWSNSSSKTLINSLSKAQKMNDQYVTVEHILLALFENVDATSQILKDQGVTLNALMQVIKDMRKGEKVTSSSQEESFQSLSKFAKNLNALARDGKLDPVIGRDEEIRRVLQILAQNQEQSIVDW